MASPAFGGLIEEFGREPVKDALAAHLANLRERRAPYDPDEAVEATRARVTGVTSSTLRRVINATGIIIHTNLGRSPVDPAVFTDIGGYSNLEFDLETGKRGQRDEHLTALCALLFGCEAAVLTNNNAAGTLLLLASVAAGREVLVSRGELVEIGGGFRVPEVIEQGGAKLREVGTTNRTRARDYVQTKRTAAILRVHRSNFDIVGFTETPSVEELVALKRVPLLYDEGSGRVVDLSPYGFARGDTIRELIAKGVDAVTCSTDKLIGATQGGLILGSEAIVAKCRKHPLMRALRAGKESYAAIGATLRAFATGKHEQLIPIYRMLSTPVEELRRRALAISSSVVDSQAALGGGTTPTQTIPSVAIALPSALHDRLRALPTPIIGRVEKDQLLLDLRTILPEEDVSIREAMR